MFTSFRPLLAGALATALFVLPSAADEPTGGDGWSAKADRYAAPAAAAEAADEAETSIDAIFEKLGAAPERWVRRLPVPENKLFLQGEHSVLKVPMHFSAHAAARAGELRLAALTGVAALAGPSRLDVYVNGSHVGELTPAYDAPARLVAPLRPGQLVAGFNEITVVARHQHRIECSIDSTYELWTRILPDETGIFGRSESRPAATVAELPDVIGSNPRPTVLRVAMPDRLDEAAATRVGRFVNTVVLNGWIADPEIVTVEDSSTGAGIDLSIVDADPATLAGRPALRQFADLPNLFAEVAPDGSNQGLMLAAASPAALDAALDALETKSQQRDPSGSTRGLQALIGVFGSELDDDATVSLANLGIETQTFAGRRFRQAIPVLLPEDFYRANYGNVLLYVDGGYMGDLLPNSTLKIKVNDVTVVTLPLDASGRTMFDDKEVRIPLGMFHAGKNLVSLEADLLTEADLTCEPEHAPVTRPRFRLEDTSRIVIPKMARVGAVPNLSATISHGFPYTLSDAPTELFIVGDRASGLGSALALMAQITANDQRVERYDIVFRSPNERDSGILVGAADAMPAWAEPLIGTRVTDDGEVPAPWLMSDASASLMGSDHGSVAGGDRGREVMLASLDNADGGTAIEYDLLRNRLGAEAPSDSGSGLMATAREQLDSFHTWLNREQQEKLDSLVAEASAFWHQATGTDDGPQRERVFKADDLVLVQTARAELTGVDAVEAAVIPGEIPPTWTILATDGVSTLSDAFLGRSDSGVRFDPAGQHYVYGGDHHASIPAGETAHLFATRGISPGNLRLVLAGWLAHNVKVYILVVLSITAVLGILTYAVTRRRSS